MIKNDRQLTITIEKSNEFKQALDALEKQLNEKPDDILLEIQRNSVKSEYEVLTRDIGHYKGLKDGTLNYIKCNNLDDLPQALIAMRIALGLTQKELAENVGIHEQQIQRYEASDYEGITFSKIADIAEAMGMHNLNCAWENPQWAVTNFLLPSNITPEAIQQKKQAGLFNLS